MTGFGGRGTATKPGKSEKRILHPNMTRGRGYMPGAHEWVNIPGNVNTRTPSNLDFNAMADLFREAVTKLPKGVQSEARMVLEMGPRKSSISITIPMVFGSAETAAIEKGVDDLANRIAGGIYDTGQLLRKSPKPSAKLRK